MLNETLVGLLKREDEQFYLVEPEKENKQTKIQINRENFVFMDYAKLATMTEKGNSFEVTLIGIFDEQESFINPVYLSYKNQRYTFFIYRSPIDLSEFPSEKRCLDYADITDNLAAWNKKTVCIESSLIQLSLRSECYLVKDHPSQIHESYQLDYAKSLMIADHDFVAHYQPIDPPKIPTGTFWHRSRMRCTTRIEWLPWYNSFCALNIRDALIRLSETNFAQID